MKKKLLWLKREKTRTPIDLEPVSTSRFWVEPDKSIFRCLYCCRNYPSVAKIADPTPLDEGEPPRNANVDMLDVLHAKMTEILLGIRCDQYAEQHFYDVLIAKLPRLEPFFAVNINYFGAKSKGSKLQWNVLQYNISYFIFLVGQLVMRFDHTPDPASWHQFPEQHYYEHGFHRNESTLWIMASLVDLLSGLKQNAKVRNMVYGRSTPQLSRANIGASISVFGDVLERFPKRDTFGLYKISFISEIRIKGRYESGRKGFDDGHLRNGANGSSHMFRSISLDEKVGRKVEDSLIMLKMRSRDRDDDDRRHRTCSQTGIRNWAVLHSHSKSKECVCSLKNKPSYRAHIEACHLDDFVSFIFSTRTQYYSNELVRNLYDTFIFCHTIFVQQSSLLNSLICQLNSLLSDESSESKENLIGGFYVLVDILSISQTWISKSIFRRLWKLAFKFLFVGRFTWALRLRTILVLFTIDNDEDYRIAHTFSWQFGASLSTKGGFDGTIYSILDNITPDSMAVELTLIHQEIYHSISANGFIANCIHKPTSVTPQLKAISKHFDRFVNWAKDLFAGSTSKEEKKYIAKYFLSLSVSATRLKNFFLLKMIHSVFQTAEVYNALAQTRTFKKAEAACASVNGENNYQNYRKELFEKTFHGTAFIPIFHVHDLDIKKIHENFLLRDTNFRVVSVGCVHRTLGNSNVEQSRKVWIDLAEAYALRKYLCKYHLFIKKPHYRFSDTRTVAKTLAFLVSDF